MKNIKRNYRDQIAVEWSRDFAATIFWKIFAVHKKAFKLWRFESFRWPSYLYFRLKLSLRPVEILEKLKKKLQTWN